MGVDARILLQVPAGTMTPEMREDLQKRLGCMLDIPDLGIDVCDWLDSDFKMLRAEGFDIYEVETWFRYWGQSYERGPLPLILFALDYLSTTFAGTPGAKVYYGSDSGGYFEEYPGTLRAELLAHACGPHGNDYRLRRQY